LGNPIPYLLVLLLVALGLYVAVRQHGSSAKAVCQVVAHDISASTDADAFRDILKLEVSNVVSGWPNGGNSLILFPVGDSSARARIQVVPDDRSHSFDDPEATKKANNLRFVNRILRDVASQRIEPAPTKTAVLDSLVALSEQLADGNSRRSCEYRLLVVSDMITTGMEPSTPLDAGLCRRAFGIFGGAEAIHFAGVGFDPDATSDSGVTLQQQSALRASWNNCADGAKGG
jgi:hypothetical protein